MTKDGLVIIQPGDAVEKAAPVNAPRGKARAESRRRAAFSEATQKQYNSLWNNFLRWWSGYAPGRSPTEVTAEEVTWYLAEREESGRSYATLLADYNAIDFAVRRFGKPTLRTSFAVREFLSGMRREEDTSSIKKKAITLSMLHPIVAAIPTNTLIGLRDRALLTVGWHSAQRREELCRMCLANIVGKLPEKGYEIHIPRSKTDQEGRGHDVMIWRRPPWGGPSASDALDSWLRALDETHADAPIFRSLRNGRPTENALTGHDVSRILKSRMYVLHEDPSIYGAHSLRAGFVTEMRSRGMTFEQISAYTGHRGTNTIKGYDRPKEKVYPVPKDTQ